MSDPEDIDDDPQDMSADLQPNTHSIINVLTSRTRRLGTGAQIFFRQSSSQNEISHGEEHDEQECQDEPPKNLKVNGAAGGVGPADPKGPVRTQQSDNTSGYSSAHDLTPDQVDVEESSDPPIPDVLTSCVSQNSMPSNGPSADQSSVSSVEVAAPTVLSAERSSGGENVSGPSTSRFYGSDAANPPEDVQSKYVSQVSIDPDEDLIDKIRKNSSCGNLNCTDQRCKDGGVLVQMLTSFLDECDAYTTNRGFFFEKALPSLKAIRSHSEDCEEIKCRIPLCYFYKQKDYSETPWKLQVQHIREEYFSGNPVLMFPRQSLYKKLTHTSSEQPVEGADFNNLTRIGDFGNAVIAQADDERSHHWWIKRCYMVQKDRLQHTTAVLQNVTNNPNVNVLPHLWYIRQEDHLLYATPFMSTLAQKLTKHKGGFLEEACWMLMQQFVDAADFLHSKGILYLNWQSKNIIYETDKGLAKITNFTNAVQLPVENAEEKEDVLASLQEWMSPRLVPPEIYQSDYLGVKNDIWGLASLLYEMATGSLIHENYCHEDPATIRDLLTENPVVNIDRIKSPPIKKLLRRSLKVRWEARSTLEELKITVTQNLTECRDQPS